MGHRVWLISIKNYNILSPPPPLFLSFFTLSADVYRAKVVNREAYDQFCTRTAYHAAIPKPNSKRKRECTHKTHEATECYMPDDYNYTPPNPQFLRSVDRNTFLRAAPVVTTNEYKIILYVCTSRRVYARLYVARQ